MIDLLLQDDSCNDRFGKKLAIDLSAEVFLCKNAISLLNLHKFFVNRRLHGMRNFRNWMLYKLKEGQMKCRNIIFEMLLEKQQRKNF